MYRCNPKAESAVAGQLEKVKVVAPAMVAVNDPASERSMVVAPLKVEGARLGVVGTASKEPVEFQAGDLKILTAIAALTAPFVSQAQRYESVARGDE